MILEVAILQVIPELTEEFEASFREASKIISAMDGYIKHELQRCLEKENQYILFVHWDTPLYKKIVRHWTFERL